MDEDGGGWRRMDEDGEGLKKMEEGVESIQTPLKTCYFCFTD